MNERMNAGKEVQCVIVFGVGEDDNAPDSQSAVVRKLVTYSTSALVRRVGSFVQGLPCS